MKIRIGTFCWQCHIEKYGNTDDIELIEKERSLCNDTFIDLNDLHSYEYICPNKHLTITRTQEQKFEILFDQGTLALLDGYTKEAVTTYASALERFYEYYSLAISIKHSINLTDYKNMKNLMAKQSERQLGAFMFARLIEGHSNFIHNDKKSSFRNDVVHKGYIPTTQETIKYGEYVLSAIYSTIKELYKSMPNFYEECHWATQKIKFPTNSKKAMYQTGGGSTLIGLHTLFTGEFGKMTLQEIINDKSKHTILRKIYYSGI